MHSRRHPSPAMAVALIALFVSLGGTAAALSGSNTVQSDDLGPGSQVKAPDVAANAVNGSDVVDGSIQGADVAGLTGADVSGLTGADIIESTLDSPVPSAVLGGLGRSVGDASCDPETNAFVGCGFLGLDLPRQTRVLLTGVVTARPDSGSSNGRGTCMLAASPGPVSGSAIDIQVIGASETDNAPMVGVTEPLGPGVVFFGVECNESPLNPAIRYPDAAISAVAISPG
jgi:hypothetical protein